jgi:hypothetical protein
VMQHTTGDGGKGLEREGDAGDLASEVAAMLLQLWQLKGSDVPF